MWYEIRDGRVFRGPCSNRVGEGDWRPGVDVYDGEIDHSTQEWGVVEYIVDADKVARVLRAQGLGADGLIAKINERINQIMSRFELLDLWSIRELRAGDALILDGYEVEALALRAELSELKATKQDLENPNEPAA